MSSVIKRPVGYTYNENEKRVIDTNQLMADRLEMLAQIMQQQVAEEENFEDDFSEGLEALQVERLLADAEDGEFAEDGDFSGNVIKAGPTQQEIEDMTAAILADANAQAEEILAKAQADAETIKERARAAGEQEGYNQGYLHGRDDAKAELDIMVQELEAERVKKEKDYEAKLDELEPQFVEAITEAYEHVFHVKLAEYKEIIFYLIQDAVRKVEGNKNFIIHVSKEDYGFVSMQKRELLAGVAGGDSAEIVEDMTLRANECYIETGVGIFDCSLETQLTGLKRELMLLSYNREQ